ncbi:MoaD/ThiS family protein [Nocardioides marmoraquaticus]
MVDREQPQVSAEGSVTLRYWASARAAAGVDSEVFSVSGPIPLSDLLRRATQPRDRRFADVVGCCSVMVGDRPVTTEDPAGVLVQPGATVELLPPFAGG